jgi:hypothetical protein
MIACIVEIISSTNIIYMILIYDTTNKTSLAADGVV